MPLVSRLYLDVSVAPLDLKLKPENNHIEEGGRVSLSCTATQVGQEVGRGRSVVATAMIAPVAVVRKLQ